MRVIRLIAACLFVCTSTVCGQSCDVERLFSELAYQDAERQLDSVTADMNGDGLPDLVFASTESQVSVFLNDGDRTFQLAGRFSTVGESLSVAVGDFNNDGDPDVVTGLLNTQVAVLLGNGDGTLQQNQRYTAGRTTNDVEVGDFDDDGNLDILAVNTGNQDLSILFGLGDGTFEPEVEINVGIHVSRSAVADVNSDSRDDVIFWTSVDLHVNLAQADRTFVAMPLITTDSSMKAVEAADMTGDSIIDVVLARNDRIAVYPGLNDGTFGVPIVTEFDAVVNDMSIGHLDDDGDLDVILAANIPDSIGRLVGDGLGGFSDVAFFDALREPLALSSADFDDDGLLDAVFIVPASEVFWVSYGTATLDFGSLVSSLPMGVRAAGVQTGDFNGDDAPDLAVSLGDDRLLIYHGDGVGSFNLQQTIMLPLCMPLKSRLLATHIDNDAHTDLVIANCQDATVSILYGDPTGLFTLAATLPTEPGPRDVAVGDLNGDMMNDLVVACSSGALSVLLCDGNGTFELQPPVGGLADPISVVLADVDQSTSLDAIVVDENNASFRVLKGMNDGTFGVPTSYVATNSLEEVETTDLNDDGFSDVIAVSSQYVSIHMNASNGTFQQGVQYARTTSGSAALTLADMDQDGTIDIVINFAGVGILIMRGLGGSAFENSVIYRTGVGPSSIVAADLNLDGAIDLVTANEGGRDLSILLSQCNPCRADIIDPIGVVDVFDLLTVLMNWGTDGPGATIAPPEDQVDIFDLLAVLASWGDCL